MAGREPPGWGWLTSPGWQGLVRNVPLGALDDEDAARLVEALGLPAALARRANGFARGHPLAFELAAGPPAAVIAQLVDAFLEGLDPDVVEAVRAASLLRRVDASLLGALVDRQPGEAAYERLRALPFCEVTADGLVPTRSSATPSSATSSSAIRGGPPTCAAGRPLR